MPAYKKGTEGHLRQREHFKQTMIAKYGGEDAYRKHYREIGSHGGNKSRGGGFASQKRGADGLTGPERARLAGAIGGVKSVRTKMPRNAEGKPVRKDGKLWGEK